MSDHLSFKNLSSINWIIEIALGILHGLPSLPHWVLYTHPPILHYLPFLRVSLSFEEVYYHLLVFGSQQLYHISQQQWLEWPGIFEAIHD